MPSTLYYVGGSSPARAAWMTCKAIGLEVQPKSVDMFGGEMFEEWFLKINPQHKVPTLDDNGFYLWESRAIMRYVMNAYAPDNDLYPKDPKKRAIVDRVLDQDLGTIYKHVLEYVRPQKFLGAPEPDKTNMVAALRDMETLTPLADGQYITGSTMTIADISTYCSVTFLEALEFDFSPYPVLVAWMDKVKAKPCFSEVNEAFQEYLALAKTDEFKKKLRAILVKVGELKE